MQKFFKMVIGIGMLPLCWATSIAIYKLYQSSIDSAISSGLEPWSFSIGFFIWVLVFFILPRPMRTYVLGHELTHALWALMMGGRIGKIRVGKTGGYVELSKTNFVITLAPYFFPFYTFLIIAIYYLTSLTLEVEPYRMWWLGAVGFTWSFHITFTIHMLSEHQPDVQEHGRIFSYTVIYIMNVLLIGIWMVMVGSPKWHGMGGLLGQEISIAYTTVGGYIMAGWMFVIAFFEHSI